MSFQSYYIWLVSSTGPITCKKLTTGLVCEGRAVNIVCLNFSKASHTAFHKTLIKKLKVHELDEQTLKWAKSWLNG